MTTNVEQLNQEIENTLKKIGFFELTPEQQQRFIEHTLSIVMPKIDKSQEENHAIA